MYDKHDKMKEEFLGDALFNDPSGALIGIAFCVLVLCFAHPMLQKIRHETIRYLVTSFYALALVFCSAAAGSLYAIKMIMDLLNKPYKIASDAARTVSQSMSDAAKTYMDGNG